MSNVGTGRRTNNNDLLGRKGDNSVIDRTIERFM